MIMIDETYQNKFTEKTYIALGSFDGIHKGHLTLMEEVIKLSEKNDAKSMVYTFKNHPLTIISKTSKPKIIMSNDKKIKVLKNMGIDIVCLETFDRKLMGMEPKTFIEMLLKNFNAKGIVVGFNYRFGYKNKGDIALLEKLSKELNFELIVMKPYKEDGNVISSSLIREFIAKGKIEQANKLLTRAFELDGIVVHGKKLGRTIGFPTVNLKYNEEIILPKIGVYYTNVEIDNKIYKGITNVGNNPTVNGDTITVETYILNFSKDVYGQKIRIYFIEHIREQKKFESLESLKKQLEKDKMFAYERKIKIIL
ncbi:MAG: bifunctional riboflavin kinase/FAD synthetase [Sarcina sp.]